MTHSHETKREKILYLGSEIQKLYLNTKMYFVFCICILYFWLGSIFCICLGSILYFVFCIYDFVFCIFRTQVKKGSEPGFFDFFDLYPYISKQVRAIQVR